MMKHEVVMKQGIEPGPLVLTTSLFFMGYAKILPNTEPNI